MSNKTNQYGDWPIIGWWASIAFACAISGFVVGWLWGTRSGAVANIRLLDLMTACGTVGATVFAAFSVFQGMSRERKQRQREIASVLEPKRIAYEQLLADFLAVYDSMVGLLNSQSVDQHSANHCFLYHHEKLTKKLRFSAPAIKESEFGFAYGRIANSVSLISASITMLKLTFDGIFVVSVKSRKKITLLSMRRADAAMQQAVREIKGLYPDMALTSAMKDSRAEFLRRADEFDAIIVNG